VTNGIDKKAKREIIMKKLLFVFNPHSGKAQIKNKLLQIVQIFSSAHFEVTVYPTKAVKDGYYYILENGNQYDLIACSGGDGTLNETVGAVLKLDRRIPIGYIPSGSTNDFATTLNIPKKMPEAAQTIVSGIRFHCDIGLMNGERNFNYIAAFGAFTKVSYETSQQLKNMLGHQAYIIEGIKSLTSLKPQYVRVKSDSYSVEGNFIYGMVSNSESVGGVKGITGKEIDLQDGLFEVLLVRELKTPLDVRELINAVISQKYDKEGIVCFFKAKHIEFESGIDISWTLDGEYGGDYKNAYFDVIENAVDFIVPQESSVEYEVRPEE